MLCSFANETWISKVKCQLPPWLLARKGSIFHDTEMIQLHNSARVQLISQNTIEIDSENIKVLLNLRFGSQTYG